MVYLCDECDEQFSTAKDLEKHASTLHEKQHDQKYFQCEHCNATLKDSDNLEKHVREYHKIKIHRCKQCRYKTNRAYKLIEHQQAHITKPNSPTKQISQIQPTSQSQSFVHIDKPIRSVFRGKTQEGTKYVKSQVEDKKVALIHKKQHAQEYFQCEHCNKSIKNKNNFLRHVKEQHEVDKFSCVHCNYKTNRKHQMNEHKKIHNVKASTPQVSKKSRQISTPQPIQQQLPETISQPTQQDKPVRSAFGGKMQERVWFIRGSTDPLGALQEYKQRIRDALFLSLKQNPQKYYIAIKVRFFKQDKDGNRTEDSAFFHGTMHTLLRDEEFEEAFQTSLKKIWSAFDVYLKNGSGWILERVEKILLNTYNYQPIGVSSYIPTPESVATKKAVINVQNKNDQKCFEYSVLAALYHHKIDKRLAQRPSKYNDYIGKRLKGCKEPMTMDDIPNFETLNDISIAVYRIKHDGKMVFPLYMTKRRIQDPINLLLIEGEEHCHFAWIKDFNRLLGRSTKKGHTKLFCPYCCYGFQKNRNGKRNLVEHKIYCRPHGAQRTKFLPK